MTPRYSIDPADTDGGMTTAAIEKDIERATALMQLRGLGDDGTALRCAVMIAQVGAGEDTVAEFCEQIARGEDVNVAARAEKAENALQTTMGRAIKAERERDELRDAWEGAIESVKEANALINALRAEQPRPLTPEDITDEMVERARRAEERQCGDYTSPEGMRDIIAAALTKPHRPEWEAESAERIKGAFWGVELPNEAGEVGDVIANRLARHGYKVVRAPGDKS